MVPYGMHYFGLNSCICSVFKVKLIRDTLWLRCVGVLRDAANFWVRDGGFRFIQNFQQDKLSKRDIALPLGVPVGYWTVKGSSVLRCTSAV
jgi:hypothetical protein